MGRESEVVGKELEPLLRLRVQIGDAAERIRVNGGGFKRRQDNGVIGSHASRLVQWMGVAPLQQDVLFGTYDEECRAESEHKKALEIDIASVHDVERTGLGEDLIQNVHVVHFAVCNADKRRNIAVQVEQRMYLHRCFVLAKLGPRE